MTRRARAMVAVGLLALTAGGVAACSSDDDDAVESLGSQSPSQAGTSPTPSTTPSTTEPVGVIEDLQFTRVVGDTSTGNAAADGAVRAYIGYTEISGRIFAQPDPEATGADLYGSGTALDQAVDLAAQLAEDEQALQGTVVIRPEVAETGDRLVVIEDCMDQSDLRLHYADGRSEDIDQADWLDIRAEVQRVTGQGWRVSTYQLDGRNDPCEG